jgi:hypothetical protein
VYRNNKIFQPVNGWAMPLATDEHYQLSWDAPSTPESFRLEISDLKNASRTDATIPEFIFVTVNYSQPWGYVGTKIGWNDLIPNTTDFPSASLNNTGESYRNYDNNTLSVLLSGRSNPDNDAWYWNQQVTVRASSCPPAGCPPPNVAIVERDASIR